MSALPFCCKAQRGLIVNQCYEYTGKKYLSALVDTNKENKFTDMFSKL